MASNKVIEKKDITKLGLTSMFLQASFNYERMQAGGFLCSQLPLLKKIYKDDKEGLSAAMQDNLEFINTHPNLVGFLMGNKTLQKKAGGKMTEGMLMPYHKVLEQARREQAGQ